MAKKHAPRHRAARRPLTPLTGINTAANRRKAAAVAATGLGVAFVVSSNAVAAGDGAKGADVARIATQAKTALKTNPEVAVAKDAKWDGAAQTTASVAVAQPRVEPAVVRAAAQRGQAGGERAAAAASDWGKAAAATQVSASVSGGSVVDIAMRYAGVPYVWGGNTPSGFDCSGFTRYVYSQVGISLPRTAGAQGARGHRVSRADARPGDLLSWPGHVGIYVGNGQMIDAPKPGDRVRVRSIWGNPQVRRF